MRTEICDCERHQGMGGLCTCDCNHSGRITPEPDSAEACDAQLPGGWLV